MVEIQKIQKEYTVSVIRIYTLSLLIIIPVGILIVFPYLLVWGNHLTYYIHAIFSTTKINLGNLFFYINILRDIFIVTLFFLVGAVLHELLHAIFWIFYTKKGIKSVKFGFTKADFSPYIHCIEPLPVWVYRIGIILPGLILGLFPAVISIITGNFKLMLFGVFFLWAASGDFIVFWLIRNLERNKLVQDHPEKVGCIVTD